MFTLNENSGTRDLWLQGGKIYQFRSQDDSRRVSGVYKGGEDQGGGAGRASGGDFDITIHDNGAFLETTTQVVGLIWHLNGVFRELELAK